MKFSKVTRRFLQCAIALVCMAQVAMAEPSSNRIGRYEFGYKSEGDRLVRPDQVFDDGSATFFQFPTTASVPAIFRLAQTGHEMVEPRVEGPYVKVDGVSGEYIIRLGQSVGKVTFTGQERFTSATAQQMLQAGTVPHGATGTYHRILSAARDAVSTVTARFGTRNPVAETANTYATPVSGDVVAWGPVAGKSTPSVTASAQPQTGTDISFLKNSYRLGSKDKSTIKKAIQAIKRNSNYRIELFARDDTEHKEGVAEARLNAVTQFLIKQGIPSEFITGKTTDVVKPSGNSFIGITLVIKPSSNSFENTAGQAFAANASALPQFPGVLTPHRPITTYATPGGQFGTSDVISVWQMLKTDGHLEGTLKRWATSSGWRLVWKGPVIEVTGNATVERAGFLQASEFVIEQTRKAGYAIKGTAYSNNTMVITAE